MIKHLWDIMLKNFEDVIFFQMIGILFVLILSVKTELSKIIENKINGIRFEIY
jgi:hypothetical protein